MGDRDGEAKPADRRYLWVGERICSSLKVKDDSYQKLLASENRQEAQAVLLASEALSVGFEARVS